jgi:hypothetical protein
MGTNNITCPGAPNGQLACEPHQLAICRVKAGEASGQCISPPPEIQTAISSGDLNAAINWACSVITGGYRSPFQPVSEYHYELLRKGRYADYRTKEDVTFSLPKGFFEIGKS